MKQQSSSNLEFNRKTRSDKGKKRGRRIGSRVKEAGLVTGTGALYVGTLAASDKAAALAGRGITNLTNKAKERLFKSKFKSKIPKLNIKGAKAARYGAALVIGDQLIKKTSSAISRVRNRDGRRR